MRISSIMVTGWEAYRRDDGPEYPTTGYARLPLTFTKDGVTYPMHTTDWTRRHTLETQEDEPTH